MKYEKKKLSIPDKSRQRIKPVGDLYNNQTLALNTRKALNEIVGDTRVQAIAKKTIGHSDSRRTPTQGIFALFSGPGDTGKTLAVKILASELAMDIYRVDLAAVAGKYIGETEKNLSKVFKKAEKTNSLLFFNEVDALFGKRSEVKNSHDRYANLEISDLLSRMEDHCGLAVLSTNKKKNLDPAFVRHFQYILEFQSSDEKENASSSDKT